MAQNIYHARLFKADGNNNVNVVYPITKDVDVEFSRVYPNLPEKANTLDDVLRALNPLAFGKNMVTPESIGLGNLTNDKQVKGIDESEEDHVLVFGKDGYTIKDSGHTIKSDVPENAKFTDTTYEMATTKKSGITILSDDLTSPSDVMAATIGVVSSLATNISRKLASIRESENDGAFSFDNMDVRIHGLKSAAFMDASAFASAKQGEKADKAIYKIKIGNVYEGTGLESADVHTREDEGIVTLDFTIPRGNRGTLWHTGTAITGVSEVAATFPESNITYALENDYYLNKNTGNYYHCVFSGDPHTALWVYEGCLRAAGSGSSDSGGSTIRSLKISEIVMLDPDESPRVENIGTVVEPDYILYIPGSKQGSDGSRGSNFYSGIALTGEEVSPTVFPTSGLENAAPLDKYINTETGTMYECVTGGNAATATWKYLMSLAKAGDTSGNIPISTTEPESDGVYFLVVEDN